MKDQEILVIDKRVKVTDPGTTRIFNCSREEIIEKYKGEYNIDYVEKYKLYDVD